ncbi:MULTISPECIES: aldo/keto reductase [Rothia]|uniref:Aldo/keto reductase n=1 Tax=Rothia nasimurium TaxID=85336 RepID=A0A1Y1RMA2_9MICC|nr:MULTISPECIES: aldo/keto reductase [Rothia]ORC15559.1 aldo/keto reductase [Rothia nasimurium]
MQNHILRDGNSIPPLGLGTYPLNDVEAEIAVSEAIVRGYRLIDTAVNYKNEIGVARGVLRSGTPRDEIFVQSKLPGRDHSYEGALRSLEGSLQRMGLDYLDAYLIHWPNPSQGLYVDTWRGLIKAQEEGLVKSIGVSNFLPEHIDRLIEETGVAPAINQIELHPYSQKRDWAAYNLEHAILTQCWSPLGRGTDLLKDAELAAIAAETGKTAGQVILRWEVQKLHVPLPKTGSPDRMEENLAVFDWELTDKQMARLDALEAGLGRGFDPNTHEEM